MYFGCFGPIYTTAGARNCQSVAQKSPYQNNLVFSPALNGSECQRWRREMWHSRAVEWWRDLHAGARHSQFSHFPSFFSLLSLSFPASTDGDSSWWMQHSLNGAWTNQSRGWLGVQLEHSIPALLLIPLLPSLLFGLPWKETRQLPGRQMGLASWLSRGEFSKQLQGSLEKVFWVAAICCWWWREMGMNLLAI